MFGYPGWGCQATIQIDFSDFTGHCVMSESPACVFCVVSGYYKQVENSQLRSNLPKGDYNGN